MDRLLTVEKLEYAQFRELEEALLPIVVPLEQSPLWGSFDDSIPGRTFLGSFSYNDSEGRLIALGSATLYRQKGRDWIWFKHGPLFASMPNSELVQKMCATLTNQFKTIEGTQPSFIRLTVPTRVKQLVLPFEHTMYDQTVIVDLTQTEDEILAGMSQSGRKGIRTAAKCAIEVSEITSDRSGYFKTHCYPILKETGTRDGFGIHPLSLYTSLLATLPDNARLYVAYSKKQVAAWAITTEYNGQAMYYYGGSSSLARDTFAAYALHWEVIKAMKARGNVSYDFMGIAGKNYEGLKNVTQFKIKFSKNIVDIPFTYDLPLKKAKYFALASAIKLKRRLPI
ncbi:peptidoglycan bridge formation glycyltransferase FemA/FemB family protein [Candidatus Saccharibacteria bacterium]|nr:peptidoglycan bridge formation glycyltransferase FemA/FemB family protein [Candidatus Saccharibacteria bacterium]